MKKIVKLIVGAVAFGVIAGVVFHGIGFAGQTIWGVQTESGTNPENAVRLSTAHTISGSGSTDGSVSAVAEKVLPSIVAIDVTEHPVYNTPFGVQSGKSTGSASGIIFAEKDNKLYIATNNHVVEGADSVKITFNDESEADAVVRGTDAATDLAVVMVDMDKLSADTKKNIEVAEVGDSKTTKVGEQAIAIGNALGYGTSVTVGYVSAKDREIDAEDSTSVRLIQTDAAINPGNSGGALVNSRGEVIGINSSKFASEQIEGMGFAIPMETAKPILEKLMNQVAFS